MSDWHDEPTPRGSCEWAAAPLYLTKSSSSSSSLPPLALTITSLREQGKELEAAVLEEMADGQLPSDVCQQVALDMEHMSKRQLEGRGPLRKSVVSAAAVYMQPPKSPKPGPAAASSPPPANPSLPPHPL